MANRDLIRELDDLLEMRRQRVELKYVPAHDEVFGNEKADRMATYGAALRMPDERQSYICSVCSSSPVCLALVDPFHETPVAMRYSSFSTVRVC